MANNLSKAILGVVWVFVGDSLEKVARCSTLYTERGLAEWDDEDGDEAMIGEVVWLLL